MTKPFLNRTCILILAPSMLWTIIGIGICIVSKGKWYHYTAALLPCIGVILSYIITFKSSLIRGLLLIIESALICYLSAKYLPNSQMLAMIILFAAPILLCGTINIANWIKKFIISF